jgi:DNA polymerase
VPKSKQAQLDQIKADIVKKRICPDLAKSAKHMVFGEGSPNADIVFIGEAPGKNEDLTGRPFVGAAGKFLDEMLETIGFEREEVYITSILKYRPPGNRDPLADEKEAFWPFLQAQLEVIQPKVVVTLGRHSTNCFLPDLQISKIHGKPKRVKVKNLGLVGRPRASAMQGDGEARTEPYQKYGSGALEPATQQSAASWVILPLYHPAAALYNNSMRQTLIDDFTKLPAILAKLGTSN